MFLISDTFVFESQLCKMRESAGEQREKVEPDIFIGQDVSHRM